jgi:hypothetical protein
MNSVTATESCNPASTPANELHPICESLCDPSGRCHDEVVDVYGEAGFSRPIVTGNARSARRGPGRAGPKSGSNHKTRASVCVGAKA